MHSSISRQPRRATGRALLALIPLLALTVGACTSIGDIRSNPRSFVGRRVLLRGEVTTARAVPFADVHIITVADRSGVIAVISPDEWRVGQRYRRRVQIAGIATDEAERGTEELVEIVADFLVSHEIVDRGRARRSARAVEEFVSRLLPAIDAALFAVES